MTTRVAWMRAVLVMAAVVALDQLSKHFVRTDIAMGEHRHVAPGVNLVHVSNSGVAFSALSNAGWIVPVFIAAAIVALLAYFATHATRPLAWLAVGLLLGGAIGNAVDRIAHGAVTDFVKLPHWPAFNVADTAITFGVLVLVLVLERGDRAPDR
jgi:signal peptidase II